MTAGQRFRFSARALGGGLITAFIIGTIAYLLLDYENPDELSKLAFWTLLCALWVAILAFSYAGARFVFAVLLGGLTGFAFAFVALPPVGFFPGRFEAPVILIWPSTGIGALAYAASRSHARTSTARGSRWWALAGIVGAIGFAVLIKSGFARIAEPLDFARYHERQPPVPRIDNVIGTNAVTAVADSCRGTAIGPRLLSDAGIAIDSAVPITVVGSYADVRTSADKSYGYRVRLWRSSDETLHGFLEQHTGAVEPVRVMLEQIEHAAAQSELSFRAHFDDGYFVEFAGHYNPGNMQGALRVIDGACTAQLLSSTRVVLTSEFEEAKRMWPGQAKRTLSDFGAQFASVFRRAPTPTFPDPPILSESIKVATRFWYEDGTSAAAFSARFMSAPDMQRYVDSAQVIGSYRGKQLRMEDVRFARATDPRSNTASWIMVGPSVQLRQYIAKLHTALAAKDGLQHLSYQMLPVQLLPD